MIDTELLPREEDDIARAQKGNAEAFDGLYRRHFPGVLAVALNHGPPQAAEDTAQEAFEKAFANIGSFKDGGRGIGPWLTTIALNQARNNWKKGKRRLDTTVYDPKLTFGRMQSPDDVEEEVMADLWLEDLSPPLKEAMEHLRERNQKFFDTVCAVWVDGQDPEDYANRAEVSPATVRTRLFRAKRELRSVLGAA